MTTAIHHPEAYERRAEELAYLANVLIAGAVHPQTGDRFEPRAALGAASATVTHGARLELERSPASPLRARKRLRSPPPERRELAVEELAELLLDVSLDRLFRVAAGALSAPGFRLGGSPDA